MPVNLKTSNLNHLFSRQVTKGCIIIIVNPAPPDHQCFLDGEPLEILVQIPQGSKHFCEEFLVPMEVLKIILRRSLPKKSELRKMNFSSKLSRHLDGFY